MVKMFLADRICFQPDTINFQPLLDLYETEEHIVLEMDVPGINPEDVLIKVLDDIVVIEGIRRKEYEGGRLKFICMERNLESFRRIVGIPAPVESGNGKASYNEGVLRITLPKVRDKVFKIKIEK